MAAVVDRDDVVRQVEDLSRDALLSLAEDVELRSREAERDRLVVVHQWCLANPAPSPADVAVWAHAGRLDTRDVEEAIGADGTPTVAAFAIDELAAVLGISSGSALRLAADVLNLAHRHPLVWAHVLALRVTAWRARRVAQAAAGLSCAAARRLDELVVTRVDTVGAVTIDRLVAEAAAEVDGVALDEVETEQEADWHVTLDHPEISSYAGTSRLDAAGDTQDLTAFHDLVVEVAQQLHDAGDDTPLETRKAKALGHIAARAAAGRHPLDASDLTAADGQPVGWSLTGRGGRARSKKLYLHVSAADLGVFDPFPGGQQALQPPVGSAEGLGPVTLARIAAWLDGSRITIQPVLRLDQCDPHLAVDEHDPPAWMRELVILRDRHCVHPHCTVDARSCDLDHIDPYVEGGPPGQTRPANLAPLCRRHHRAKTRGGWRYVRNRDGTYTWTAPNGRRYHSTCSTTIPLAG